jgi:hypothetical protein
MNIMLFYSRVPVACVRLLSPVLYVCVSTPHTRSPHFANYYNNMVYWC